MKQPLASQETIVSKYRESDEQMRSRFATFTHHPPNRTQVYRFEAIRERACDLAFLLNHACPPSHELSLAMDHLSECVMHANAAIARHESGSDPEIDELVG